MEMPRWRFLTWNVNGRIRAGLDRQLETVANERPDLVALQEVHPAAVARWEDGLAAIGLEHHALTGGAQGGGRDRGLVLAARSGMESVVHHGDELLSATITLAGVRVRVHTAHVPNGSSHGWGKVEALRHLRAVVLSTSGPQVVLGDLNTPQGEDRDGHVLTLARTPAGRLRKGRGQEWDDAEMGVLRGLEPHGVRDLFRALHGYGCRQVSWKARQGTRPGYRLDHILASQHFEPLRVDYLHSPRCDGLSDHSVLVVEAVMRDARQSSVPRNDLAAGDLCDPDRGQSSANSPSGRIARSGSSVTSSSGHSIGNGGSSAP